MRSESSSLAVVDVAPLISGAGDVERVAQMLGSACRENGFFYVVGHGVSSELQGRLERLSRQFFDQDLETKLAIRMERGGRAWRGYFPVGRELTRGRPDQKEGLYFGAELSADNRRMMYVPRGFAHGFLTLTEDVEAFYLVSAFYAPDRERGVRWNDPRFAINWPAEPLVISDKDKNQRDFDPAWHLEAPPPSPPPQAGEG